MDEKINWVEAYSFFIASEQCTLRTTAEQFHIDYEYLRQRASDENWVKCKEDILQSARFILQEQARDDLVRRNQEMVKLARAMQIQGAQKIADGTVELKSARDIRDWILTGIEIERRCLNMDVKKPEPEQEQKRVIITWGDGKPLQSYDERRRTSLASIEP